MGNVAQTNVASLNAQRNLYKTNNQLSTTFQRLSSGFRINSAKDDAAGLVISNKLTSQIVSLNVGIRNANDGISLAQTAEGALQEVTNLLLRGRELAMSSASGQNQSAAREALDAEFQQIKSEINRIASDTKFGGTTILDGTVDFAIQVGEASGDTISVNSIDLADNTAVATVLLADVAASTGGTVSAVAGSAIDSVSGANAMLTAIDNALTSVDTARGDLGAKQNRLQSTISNLQNVVENVSASRSRIRDTDFATETANLAKNQILQQAGLSILSQANASTQSVLSLLQ